MGKALSMNTHVKVKPHKGATISIFSAAVYALDRYPFSQLVACPAAGRTKRIMFQWSVVLGPAHPACIHYTRLAMTRVEGLRVRRRLVESINGTSNCPAITTMEPFNQSA